MKHVDHDLGAYTEGMMSVPAATRVRKHLAECSECREKLSEHEALVRDLKLSLARNTVPRDRQINEWWQNIVTAPRELNVRSRSYATMLPALLTVLMLILPFSLAVAGHSKANTAPIRVTMSSPAANTTITAPDSDRVALRSGTDTTNQPAELLFETRVSANSTTVPVIPAPLAP
jgi:anti-sigma factor RsiW